MGLFQTIAKGVGTQVIETLGDSFGALRNVLNYNRTGSQIADQITDIPSAREVGGLSFIPEAGATTSVESVQPRLLREHQSEGFISDETVPPEQIGIGDLKGKTLMSIVGDPTGRHIVTGVGGQDLPEPVASMAGFQYIDVPGQGYAGASGATSSKINEARNTENPYYTSLMMGEQSGDFAMHTGEVFGQMFRNAAISQKDIPKIDEFIRNLGMPVKVKQTMPDGTVKNVGKTIKAFTDFPSVKDPDAMLNYIRNLPTGTHRAYFLKGLDKAGLQKMGVPRVGDARLAVADPAQIGMDWGTTGYRGFVPDLEKGALPTTRENSTTYDTGIDKVGLSQSFIEEGRGIPANLLYRDLAEKRRELGTGGNLVMNSADYKVYESSPKKAKHGSGQKKAKKSAGSDSDDAVFDLSNVAPARDRPGRAKKAVNYQNFDDGSDDEDF